MRKVLFMKGSELRLIEYMEGSKKDLLFQYINVITIGKLKIASSSMMILFK